MVPLTPATEQIAISQHDHCLRLDLFLCDVVGHTAHVGAAATLGLGRLHDVVGLGPLIPLVTTHRCIPVEDADSLGVHSVRYRFDFGEEGTQFTRTDAARCVDSHHDLADLLADPARHIHTSPDVTTIRPPPCRVVIALTSCLHEVTQHLTPVHLRLKQLNHVAVSTIAQLASSQRTLTDSLVNLTRQFALLLGGHLLRLTPAMLVEALALTTTVTLRRVLLEVVEHLRTIPATILGIEAADSQLAIHGGEVVGVVVHQLAVNHIVTGHVGQLCVLLVEMSPRGEVAVEFVIHLVQHKEAQLPVVHIGDEVSAIHLVLAVGICSRTLLRVGLDPAATDHQHTSERRVFGVGHDVDHGLLHPLLWCEVVHHKHGSVLLTHQPVPPAF